YFGNRCFCLERPESNHFSYFRSLMRGEIEIARFDRISDVVSLEGWHFDQDLLIELVVGSASTDHDTTYVFEPLILPMLLDQHVTVSDFLNGGFRPQTHRRQIFQSHHQQIPSRRHLIF